MQNNFFAVMVYNTRSKRGRCHGIFTEHDFALMLWKDLCSKNTKKYLSIYIQPCSFKTKNKIIESDIINRCYNIANCLELAERALLKRNFSVSNDWFHLAKVRSVQASVVLSSLLTSGDLYSLKMS